MEVQKLRNVSKERRLSVRVSRVVLSSSIPAGAFNSIVSVFWDHANFSIEFLVLMASILIIFQNTSNSSRENMNFLFVEVSASISIVFENEAHALSLAFLDHDL